MQLSYTTSILAKDTNPVVQRSFTNTIEINAYEEKLVRLVAGATDEEISLGNLTTVSQIYIETSQTISIKFNGIANPAIVIKDTALLNTDGVTSIHASNGTPTTADVKLFLS